MAKHQFTNRVALSSGIRPQDSPCFNATVISVMAMNARQSGEPLKRMIQAYEDEPGLTPEIKKIVISIFKFAYSVPIRATEKERDMEVTKFANQAKAACLRDRKLNSSKL